MSISKTPKIFLYTLLGTGWLLWLTLTVRIPASSSFPFLLGLVILAHWGFAWVSWHLMLRPLPAGLSQRHVALLSIIWRKRLGIALVLGIFAIGIGTVWDEVWHARFGIPFGRDLLWLPHILMYSGLALSACSSLLSSYLIFYRGKGNLEQRFRTDPLLGWNALAGFYTFWALLLDPFWHWLYGVDLKAWSLPHGVLLVMDLLMGLSALSFVYTSFPKTRWGFLDWAERNLWLILSFLGILLCFAVVLMVDVYRPMSGLIDEDISKIPLWVMLNIMSIFTAFMAALVLYSSQKIALASLIIALLIGLRYFLDYSLDSEIMGGAALWLMLAPTLAIDALALSIYRREKRYIHWGAAGLIAGIINNLINYPLILMVYGMQSSQMIDLSWLAVLLIITGNILGSLVAAWLGKNIGQILAQVAL